MRNKGWSGSRAGSFALGLLFVSSFTAAVLGRDFWHERLVVHNAFVELLELAVCQQPILVAVHDLEHLVDSVASVASRVCLFVLLATFFVLFCCNLLQFPSSRICIHTHRIQVLVELLVCEEVVLIEEAGLPTVQVVVVVVVVQFERCFHCDHWHVRGRIGQSREGGKVKKIFS